MKICLINNLYKPYAKGGAERIVELQAEGLVKAGHEVFIITTRPIFTNTQHPAPSTYYLSGLYYNLNKIPKILRLPWHLVDMLDISNYFKIKSILKKEKPDMIITHNLKGLGYLIPGVIKYLKIKHIHVLHDIQLLHPSGLMLCGKEKKTDNFFAKIYANLCCWLFGSPDIIISPSKWLMKLHEEKNFFNQSKKIILPNPAIILPENKGIKKINKTFRFLYAGQIEEHKGISFLIKSFNAFCQNSKLKNFELAIAGTGSKLEKVKHLAGSNKHIKFLGLKNNEEIKKIMEESGCLIVPSLCYENSPTVIYEATAAGLPVLTARLGGITELVRELGGILFKAGNEGDLMRQMRWIMDNSEKLEKIQGESRKKIEKLSLDNYIKTLLSA